MTLHPWDKFMKQNQFLKEILDEFDTMKKEYKQLKKYRGLSVVELQEKAEYWQRQNDAKDKEINYLKGLLREYGWEEEDEWD